MLIIEHAHVDIGILTVNIGDCVTWCIVEIITEEVNELGSQRVFVVAVGPWGIRKLQSISYEVTLLFSKGKKEENSFQC